jgi:hypothetical protein
LTGVEIVDTSTADHIGKLACALHGIVNADCTAS